MELSAKIGGKIRILIFVGIILGVATGFVWGEKPFLHLLDSGWIDELVAFAIFVGGGVILEDQADKAVAQAKAGAPTPPPSLPQEPTVQAICPQCKSRIPLESKFCLECGADLRPRKTRAHESLSKP